MNSVAMENSKYNVISRLLSRRWVDSLNVGMDRAAVLSSYLLESQLNTIEQNKTLMPRSDNKRVFGDGIIPVPNALTLFAWQSICELAAGSCHSRFPTDDEDVAYMCNPHESPDLHHEIPPLLWADPGILFWTIIQIPTLGDGHSDTHIPGAIIPSSSLIREDGGYGLWEKKLLILEFNEKTHDIEWSVETFDSSKTDTSVDCGYEVFRIMRESNMGPTAKNIMRLTHYWRSQYRAKTSTRVPAAFSEGIRNANRDRYLTNWGVDLNGPAHQHFYRIFEQHGIGFRFLSSPAKWLTGFRNAIETQIRFIIACGYGMSFPQVFIERVMDEWPRPQLILDELDELIRELNKNKKIELLTPEINMQAVKDVLGL